MEADLMPQKAYQHRSLVRWRLAACLAVAAIGTAACGGTSSSSSSDPSSSSASASSSTSGVSSAISAELTKYSAPATTYPAVAPVSGVSALKGKTVWWVPIGASIPTLAAVGNAMQSALAHEGIKLQTCDGKLLPTTIASCLSEAASQGASGVVTGFVDYQLVPTAFNNLVAHHIPVLVAGESPDGGKTSTAQLGFYPTRPADDLMQKLDLESVIANSGGKAHILYVGVTDSPETKQEAAYAKTFTAQGCPGCSFTEIDYNTAAINKLSSAVSAALVSNPNTNYVVCEVDACSPLAVAGIETAGYKTKVKLASSNGNLDSLQRIKAGNVQFTDTGVSATYFGWQFADGIIRMLTGTPPVPTLTVERVFTKDNVSGLSLTPAAYATMAWYGSNAFEQKFLAAWSNR
jgi:ribose transport system substrate-binding protein